MMDIITRLPERDAKDKNSEFIKELFALYDKYDLSISHEDIQGAFIIEENSNYNKEWMKQAIEQES